MDKFERLKKELKKQGKVAVAFSGGTDSAFLLDTAKKTLGKENVLALTVISDFLPKRDLKDIENYLSETGINYTYIYMDYGKVPGIRENGKDRCYFCKKEMFRKMKEEAVRHGIEYLADGTNADDLEEYRPGLRAKKEEGIGSPLSEAGLSKKEIRALAGENRVPYAEKPSSSCLATRIPLNREIEREALSRIDKAEEGIKDLGFEVVRVRDYDEKAEIELGEKDLSKYKENNTDFSPVMKEAGYTEYNVNRVPYKKKKGGRKQ